MDDVGNAPTNSGSAHCHHCETMFRREEYISVACMGKVGKERGENEKGLGFTNIELYVNKVE